MSPEKQAIAVAKAKLTRVKRGTLGRRQREALGKAETPTVEIGPTGVKLTPASTDQQASAEKPSS